MADAGRTGHVRFSALLKILGKLLPNLPKEFLEYIPVVNGMESSDIVSQEEWVLLVDPSARPIDIGPQPTKITKQ